MHTVGHDWSDLAHTHARTDSRTHTLNHWATLHCILERWHQCELYFEKMWTANTLSRQLGSSNRDWDNEVLSGKGIESGKDSKERD